MTDVKSCGCRYIKLDNGFEECEYLCQNHKDVYILTSFNSKRFMEYKNG